MTRIRLTAVLGLLVACAPPRDGATKDTTMSNKQTATRDYLYLWTASADTTQPDFLAVVDVTADASDTARYGRLVTTLPVPGVINVPHHTEHELPADRQLFANGYGSGRSFVFDLTTPDAPRIAAEFGDVDGYTHPHSFVRLPQGNVLATFQMKHTSNGGMRAGGLVELTPRGTLVRSVSADTPGADSGLRVYSAGVIPALAPQAHEETPRRVEPRRSVADPRRRADRRVPRLPHHDPGRRASPHGRSWSARVGSSRCVAYECRNA